MTVDLLNRAIDAIGGMSFEDAQFIRQRWEHGNQAQINRIGWWLVDKLTRTGSLELAGEIEKLLGPRQAAGSETQPAPSIKVRKLDSEISKTLIRSVRSVDELRHLN